MEMQTTPDGWTQVRQWIGLVIALGGVMYLVDAGAAIGRIEEKVRGNSDKASSIGVHFNQHIADSGKAFDNVAEALRIIDSRVSKIEGRQEERDAAQGNGH